MRKSTIILCLVISLILVINAFCIIGSAKQKTYLLITTASTGGTYYPVGIGLSTLWTGKLKEEGIQVSAQSSAGSGENINMLQNNEADLAVLQGLFGSMAWQGIGAYDKPIKMLRSITMLWPNVVHWVLVKDKVETGNVLDVKGKRVSIGRAGSGTERENIVILNGLGLSLDDISTDYIGMMESSNAMKDGKIDGILCSPGYPAAAYSDLAASPTEFSFLEITDEQIASVNELYPIFYRKVIPANTYIGQNKAVNSMAQPNWLAIKQDIDEEVVYKITKAIFENLDYLVGVHDACKNIRLDSALSGLPVPLHPGALRYYQEVGLSIPENIIPPEAK